jgi:hypothetical protein
MPTYAYMKRTEVTTLISVMKKSYNTQQDPDMEF